MKSTPGIGFGRAGNYWGFHHEEQKETDNSRDFPCCPGHLSFGRRGGCRNRPYDAHWSGRAPTARPSRIIRESVDRLDLPGGFSPGEAIDVFDLGSECRSASIDFRKTSKTPPLGSAGYFQTARSIPTPFTTLFRVRRNRLSVAMW